MVDNAQNQLGRVQLKWVDKKHKKNLKKCRKFESHLTSTEIKEYYNENSEMCVCVLDEGGGGGGGTKMPKSYQTVSV